VSAGPHPPPEVSPSARPPKEQGWLHAIKSTTAFSVKFEPGPRITLGGAAAAHARLVV
jgi:hypothetical protein